LTHTLQNSFQEEGNKKQQQKPKQKKPQKTETRASPASITNHRAE